MKDTGLKKEEINMIISVFMKFPQIEKIKLFGSRAKGNYSERSDIDFTAFREKLDRFIIAEILMELEELDIKYGFELQDYSKIRNSQLIEHIDRIGINFYEKN